MCNCWPWEHATKHECDDGPDGLGAQLEALLAAYRESTGCADGGVPAELVQGATQIADEQAPLQQSGPADAVDAGEAHEGAAATPDDSAAVLQGNMDEVSPIALREALMKTYGIHAQVNAALEDAEAGGDEDEASRLRFEDVKAVAAAVKALQDLHNEQIKQELERFHRELESAVPKAYVLRREDVLSSFAPEFWHDCFIDLFFRGDCQERVPFPGRPTKLPDFLWGKCLLSRADNMAWRTNLEFVASLYNILLRRSQMRAVHFVVVQSPVLSQTDMEALAGSLRKNSSQRH